MKITMCVLLVLAILSACSFKNKAEEKQDPKPKAEKAKNLPKPTRKRHKFGEHYILDRIMTSTQNLSMA